MFRLLPTNEEGQSVVIVALFLFFVFLAFAALAVDGTIIYMHRRNLQNIADAAALAAATDLSQEADQVAAYQTAMDTIAANDGRVEWYATSDPPNPAGAVISGTNTNTGSGVNLVSGIEISGDCNVRAALRWGDVGTFFAQFTGRDTLAVGARARTGCNAAGGLVPIAIKRFGDESDTDSWNPGKKNNPNTIYCEDCDSKLPLVGQGNDKAFDFLRPMTATDVITAWPPGVEFFQSPTPHAGEGGYGHGREYYILGAGVESSFGSNAYRGLVLPDVRHISSSPREYYNGFSAGTNPSTAKDVAEAYIRTGYRYACNDDGCNLPVPGEEVATYPGTNTSFSVQAFRDMYDIGDKVAVIVYNGTVFKSPTLNLTGTPSYPDPGNTEPITVTSLLPVTFTVSLEAESGFVSSPQGLSMAVEGLAGFVESPVFDITSPVLPYNGGDTTRDLTLTITPKLTTTGGMTPTNIVITGTHMFYVKAEDNKFAGTDIVRYWAGLITVGYDGQFKPSVTALPTNAEGTYPYLTVEQGNQAKYTINLDVWHAPGNHDVELDIVGSLPTGLSFVSPPPWTYTGLTDTDHPGAKHTLNIKVDSTAITNTLKTLTFEVSVPASPEIEPQTFNLYVLVVPPQTTIAEEYLQVLGYAAVEVTDYYPNDSNPNGVEGKVVSQLFTSPFQLALGGRPRLIPWE